MDFNTSVTKENLARAFAGLCQDHARYVFIAKSALREGYGYVSNLLNRIASNKIAHASSLYSIMLEKIKKSKDNVNIEAGYPFENHLLKTSLLDSAEIEYHQAKNVYPHFSKLASDEGFEDIAQHFLLIAEVSTKNAQLLHILADKFESKSLYSSKEKVNWVCSNCGHTDFSKQAWDVCPLCGYPKGYVIPPLDDLK